MAGYGTTVRKCASFCHATPAVVKGIDRFYADRKDNNIRFSLRTLPVMVGGFAASSIVGVFNQVVGLLRWRDQLHWVKTEHAIDADNEQIRNIAPVHHKVKVKAA